VTDHVREFQDQGFTMVRGFFSPDELGSIRAAIQETDQQTRDPLTSGGMIFNAQIYRYSTAMQQFLAQQKIIDFLEPIAGGDLWVRWDQAVTKHPGAGVFRWHQDNGYNQLLTQHYQVWIALTESRNQNGALWLAPGSHKRGRLPHRRVENRQVECTADIGETTCIDAQIGDLILFSSLMLHRTGPNEADTSRLAFVAEYMPLQDYDYYLEGPYFVVAENGSSSPRFVDRQPGAASLRNQLMYWRPTLDRLIETAKAPLREVRNTLRSQLSRTP
jgi:ectoine hydroxylase-related dioxygenase (phytanoyl-CoA dioxygenase family)